MYDDKLEKFIEAALVDGVVTEKERAVLIKKATELGIDLDEFEMILDARIHSATEIREKEKPKSNKQGDIKKCPSCGGPVTSLSPQCPDCGHEYINAKANSTLLRLLEGIEKINSQEIQCPQILKGSIGNQARKNAIDMERIKLKKELIENFPVPNSREDILEFLAHSMSKGKDASIFDAHLTTSSAWAKKAEEIIIKGKIMFKSDVGLYNQLLEYESTLNSSHKSNKRVRNAVIAVVAVILIIVYGGIMISQILK